ncbi:MAG: flavin reductase family protein [Pseudomonadota bacterium]
MVSKFSVSEKDFRKALGRFATGIVVITTRDAENRPRAITVNAFTSVSLDPPLVLYCLGKSAFHFGIFAEAKAFAVNMLSADQQAFSDRFAREAGDEFADLSIRNLVTGSPILPECLAVLDCKTETQHDAGDHLIVVGRVCAIDQSGDSEPLIYFESGYRGLRSSLDD